MTKKNKDMYGYKKVLKEFERTPYPNARVKEVIIHLKKIIKNGKQHN